MTARLPKSGAGDSDDAALIAALIAIDPVGLGGVVLRAAAGPEREQWLTLLIGLLPAESVARRVPLHVNEDRLLGGLDLSATLQAGVSICQKGLLAEADGGIVVLAMAERVGSSIAAHLTSALDLKEVLLERHGMGTRHPCRIGVVALDEGRDSDEQVAAGLRDRLAFELRLSESAPSLKKIRQSMAAFEPARGRASESAESGRLGSSALSNARALMARVELADSIVEALCEASLALGVASPRALLFAARAARALAALDGREEVLSQDAARAAALVFSHRATRMPTDAESSQESSEPAPPSPPDRDPDAAPETDRDADDTDTHTDTDTDTSAMVDRSLDDVVLAAALASIPDGLLARIALGQAGPNRSLSQGRVGALRKSPNRGRPIGSRRGELGSGSRLNLLETLRAAAPWQTLRRRESEVSPSGATPRIRIRRDDFRVWRFSQRSESTTIFVVDASGSAALHRLAETKGAVELLLADCYVRRDSVAVIAFRGTTAELLLPPTRSLVRAKRSLAGLPGGGGTPLACGLDAACSLAELVRQRGSTPMVVVLTDGRGNIARDGTPGRGRAAEDALAAARHLRLEGISALLLDTSAQAQSKEQVAQLAEAMGARYLPMPYAGAAAMSDAVRAASKSTSTSTSSPSRGRLQHG